MRIDERQFIRSDVFFEKNRLILRHGREVANPRADFLRIQVQALCNQVCISTEITRGIAQQQRRERWIVVDNDAPLAVENLAPGRENRHIAMRFFSASVAYKSLCMTCS